MEVSPGCDQCYARELMQTRFGRVTWGYGEPRVRTAPANWRQPLKWNKQAEATKTRPFVFCASLCDVFDNEAPEEWRADLFELMRATPNLVWLVLTKRPPNIAWMSEKAGGLPPNVALGITTCTRREYLLGVPHLLKVPGALFYFLSMEPLLEPIQLKAEFHLPRFLDPGFDPRVSWCIVGGESQQGAHKPRRIAEEWVENIRDDCDAFGAVFHFKQWGASREGNMLHGRQYENRPTDF